MNQRPPDPRSRSGGTHAPEPPRLAVRLLNWYCRGTVLEEVRGDLDESWASAVEDSQSLLLASLAYWKEVLLFVRSHTLRRRENFGTAGPTVMWKNYLFVALRSIRKHKTFSAINYFGLAVGLACAILIMLFVRDELSFDRYHPDANRIYRLVASQPDEDFDGIAKVVGPWGTEAARQLPAIESVTRFVYFGQAVFEVGDRRDFIVNPATSALGGFFADSTTFDVFPWPIVSGDPATALLKPLSMVVTESFARNWFGGTDVVGEVIRAGGTTDYRVVAVMEDVPHNSHFRFDFLTSMSGYTHPDHDDPVRWNQYYTYVKLTPGAVADSVAASIRNILIPAVEGEERAAFGIPYLQPLADIYLRSNMFREIGATGDLSTVKTFSLLAVFILLIAAVNFVNLTTARSSLRAREVGVRKSLGARRGVISRQFMFEALLTTLIASVVAAGLVVLALPTFNALAGKSFVLRDMLDSRTVLWSLAIVATIGLTSGIYPAFVLSSYNPSQVLKGLATSRGPVGLRKGLVVLQFAISAALIMSTGIVSDQLTFIRSKPLGFNAANVAGIPLQDDGMKTSIETIKERVRAVPGVLDVAASGNRPGGSDWGIPTEIPGRTREETPPARMLVGDHDFTNTYGMNIVEGRGFDGARVSDFENGLLINEEMARQAGWDEPIGQALLMPAIEREFQVIGVIEDFHYRSIHETISPLILFQAPNDWYSMLSVRLVPDAPATTLELIGDVYQEFDAVNPMRYSFMDGVLAQLYTGENQVGALLKIATLLAILVACLGLFGLAAFTAERRTKEIGIRKVVGASTTNIVALLTRETTILVGVALVPAVVGAFYFGGNWLSNFAYHVDISVWTLVVGAAVAIGLAVLTTGLQAWRAARLNPVSALRIE